MTGGTRSWDWSLAGTMSQGVRRFETRTCFERFPDLRGSNWSRSMEDFGSAVKKLNGCIAATGGQEKIQELTYRLRFTARVARTYPTPSASVSVSDSCQIRFEDVLPCPACDQPRKRSPSDHASVAVF